jgi:acyl-CoA synthetase (NDP forming)
MSGLQRLLQPRSVAVVGASADPSKMTGRPVAYLRKHGYAGEIFPVNPRGGRIGDLACFPSVAALPQAPDVALVLLPADGAIAAVAELAERGAGAAIVLAGGFAEAGSAGLSRNAALKAAAGDMRLLGPNTIGLVNLTDHITLSASGALEIEDLPRGAVSLVSQSGGILGSLLSRAADKGVGFAKLIATGNEADVDVSDCIDLLVDDDATQVIALYLEGLRKPDNFRRVARRAAEVGKQIVAFKVGRSAAGRQAAVSHTGALAGEDRVYDALFHQLGVIRAQTFADLLELPAALASAPRLRGERVAVMTSTGGAGALIAESCGLQGFDLPPPDAATAATLAAALGALDAAEISNPLDVTLAGLRPDIFANSITALLDSPSYDALVVVIGSSALANPDVVADALVHAKAKAEKPLLAYVSPHAPDLARLLNIRGVPAFVAPESGAAMLNALRPLTSMPDGGPPASTAAPALPEGPGVLNEHDSKALFAAFGIRVTREIVAGTAAEAEAAALTFGGPIVLKVLSNDIAHKSDIGGVRVNVAPGNVAEACEEMSRSVVAAGADRIEGVLVQELISGGIEMILGMREDPQLGPFVLLGMGGVAAELMSDVSIRLLPVGRQAAAGMIGELKLSPLLKGYRGTPPRDTEALIDAIVAFSSMGEALRGRIAEAEVNPIFVLPAGAGAIAADGLVVLRDASAPAAGPQPAPAGAFR